jgi:hypothetical protein
VTPADQLPAGRPITSNVLNIRSVPTIRRPVPSIRHPFWSTRAERGSLPARRTQTGACSPSCSVVNAAAEPAVLGPQASAQASDGFTPTSSPACCRGRLGRRRGRRQTGSIPGGAHDAGPVRGHEQRNEPHPHPRFGFARGCVCQPACCARSPTVPLVCGMTSPRRRPRPEAFTSAEAARASSRRALPAPCSSWPDRTRRPECQKAPNR